MSRPVSHALKAPFQPQHLRALVRGPVVFPNVGDVLRRYVLGTGSYPADIVVRTPAGPIAPTVFSAHDVVTVVEAFARIDYWLPRDARIVVDVGSNIGISALYFLTRDPDVRVYLYEPVPTNCERLLHNLRAFEGRVFLSEVAVSDQRGPVPFQLEPTGRDGRISDTALNDLVVNCVHIDDLLTDVLAREGRIDLLKIDTEGQETRTIVAADESLLRHVKRIYLEARPAPPLRPDLFDQRLDHAICRLVARRQLSTLVDRPDG